MVIYNGKTEVHMKSMAKFEEMVPMPRLKSKVAPPSPHIHTQRKEIFTNVKIKHVRTIYKNQDGISEKPVIMLVELLIYS